jgi:Mg-chelatase subunit ChlD
MQLTLATDRALIRATGHSTRYLHLHLLAPTAQRACPRLPLDLALVLDRSGSMAGDKWPRAREAALTALGRLNAQDRAAIVVYDDRIETLLESSPVNTATRQRAASALAAITPRGTTNLGEGWLTGCGLVGADNAPERLRRCFLLTDGLANQGITDAHTLAGHAAEVRQRGVVTSTFGVGDDYDEALLGPLADAGGGAFHDIARAEQIGPILARELGDALEVVYREVEVTLSWEGALEVQGLGSWRQAAEHQCYRLWLGDLVSEQELDLRLAITFPAGQPDTECKVVVRVSAADETLDQGRLSWRWAEHACNDHQPRNREVDRLVAADYANLARREAALDNRRGDLEQARRRLRQVAQRIRSYAGDDVPLLDLATRLDAEAERHRETLSSREAKMMYYSSASLAKGRSATGERKRHP